MPTTVEKRIYGDIVQCVGNTPLVRLRRLTADCYAEVLGKMEGPFNPLWAKSIPIPCEGLIKMSALDKYSVNSSLLILPRKLMALYLW